MLLTLFASSATVRVALADEPTSSAAGTEVLEEVLVTAQKRSERLTDVPISITAVTADDVSKVGATTTMDLTDLVPGLRMEREGNFIEPALRGISTLVVGVADEPNVATYMDGVYQANPVALNLDLADVSRIDVSKGPQGTLFGRNATGGAIQVFTLEPTNTLTGQFSAGYGSFNDQVVKGYIAGPLIPDKLLASISAFEETADSYYNNIVPNSFKPRGLNAASVRGKLLFTPTDNLKITVIGFVGHHDDASGVWGTTLDGITQARAIPGSIITSRPYDVASNTNVWQNVSGSGGSVKAELGTSIGTFTLTGAYDYSNDIARSQAFYAYVPTGAEYYDARTPDRNEQVELDLVSVKYGPFSYIAGVNYFHDKTAWDPLMVGIPPVEFVSIFGQETAKSYAAFGEATYDFTDRLTAILGARYSDETRGIAGHTLLGSVDFSTPPGGWNELATKTFVDTTPRASLRYKVTPDTNVYLTYSEGFKSGVYDAVSTPFVGSNTPPEVVKPEHLRAYEVGVKSEPANWITVDSAIFYYKYRDIQVTANELVNGIPLGVYQNAASATLYGADLEGTVKPIPVLTFKGGLSLLHSKFDSFPNASVNVPAPGLAGNVIVTQDAEGNQLPFAPSWTLNLSGSYDKTFDFGAIDLTANIYHSAGIYFDVGNVYGETAYTTVGTQASWRPSFTGSKLKITAYGKNLTNKAVVNGAFILSGATGLSYFPPRVFGFTISYDL
jgi:iron complex outermembrane receptor protein